MNIFQTRKWNITKILRAVALRLMGSPDVQDTVLIYSDEDPYVEQSPTLADSLAGSLDPEKVYKIDKEHSYTGEELYNLVRNAEPVGGTATLISGCHRTASDIIYKGITGIPTDRPERLISENTLQVAAAANGQHDLTNKLQKPDRAELALTLYRAGIISGSADLERETGMTHGSACYAFNRARMVEDFGFDFDDALTMPDKEMGTILKNAESKAQVVEQAQALIGKTPEAPAINVKQYGEIANTVQHPAAIEVYAAIAAKDLNRFKAAMVAVDVVLCQAELAEAVA